MRVVVADDLALLREGIVGLLRRQGHDVVGQAATAPELLQAVDAAVRDGGQLDVVITDVRMPPGMRNDGLEAVLRIRRDHPGVGILVVSQHVANVFTKLGLPHGEESRRIRAVLTYLTAASG